MSNFEIALNRLDDELHGQNYELYVFLHKIISEAIELQAQVNDMERMDYPCRKCEALEAQLDARQWKTPEDRYTAGILIVEIDMSNGDVCRGMVVQNDEDYNELLIADQYMDVWTDFRWPDIDRYYVLPSPEAAIKGESYE